MRSIKLWLFACFLLLNLSHVRRCLSFVFVFFSFYCVSWRPYRGTVFLHLYTLGEWMEFNWGKVKTSVALCFVCVVVLLSDSGHRSSWSTVGWLICWRHSKTCWPCRKPSSYSCGEWCGHLGERMRAYSVIQMTDWQARLWSTQSSPFWPKQLS